MPINSLNNYVAQASALLEQRIGLAANEQLRANLASALYDLAHGDPARYVQSMQNSQETAPVWQRLLKALLLGESYFFRHTAHFSLFRNYILPNLIVQRRREGQFRLNLWSAGCATGEEPYSLAISLLETMADLPRWAVNLVGSDLNAYALELARRGVYRNWAFRHTDSSFRQLYFTPVTNGFQIKPVIRSMVTFRQANLLSGPALPSADVIFCCNVLIYFDGRAVRQVEDHFYRALAPGGCLILGQGEIIRSQRERWAMQVFDGAVVFQKPAEEGVFKCPRAQTPPGRGTSSTPGAAASDYPAAVEVVRIKNYAEGERILRDVLAASPNHAAAHVLLACIYANLQRIPAAHEHLDKAIRLDALQADAYYLRGVLLLENSQHDEAKAALRSAIYCKRGHALAAMILGHLYTQSNEISKARRTWKEALRSVEKMAPDDPVSDLSDLTAEGVGAFLSSQLKALKV